MRRVYKKFLGGAILAVLFMGLVLEVSYAEWTPPNLGRPLEEFGPGFLDMFEKQVARERGGLKGKDAYAAKEFLERVRAAKKIQAAISLSRASHVVDEHIAILRKIFSRGYVDEKFIKALAPEIKTSLSFIMDFAVAAAEHPFAEETLTPEAQKALDFINKEFPELTKHSPSPTLAKIRGELLGRIPAQEGTTALTAAEIERIRGALLSAEERAATPAAAEVSEETVKREVEGIFAKLAAKFPRLASSLKYIGKWSGPAGWVYTGGEIAVGVENVYTKYKEDIGEANRLIGKMAVDLENSITAREKALDPNVENSVAQKFNANAQAIEGAFKELDEAQAKLNDAKKKFDKEGTASSAATLAAAERRAGDKKDKVDALAKDQRELRNVIEDYQNDLAKADEKRAALQAAYDKIHDELGLPRKPLFEKRPPRYPLLKEDTEVTTDRKYDKAYLNFKASEGLHGVKLFMLDNSIFLGGELYETDKYSLGTIPKGEGQRMEVFIQSGVPRVQIVVTGETEDGRPVTSMVSIKPVRAAGKIEAKTGVTKTPRPTERPTSKRPTSDTPFGPTREGYQPPTIPDYLKRTEPVTRSIFTPAFTPTHTPGNLFR